MTAQSEFFDAVKKQATSPTCFCGKPIGWTRWRMQLCGDCSENETLRDAAFHRICFEKADDPSVKSMHEGMFDLRMRQYQSEIKGGNDGNLPA